MRITFETLGRLIEKMNPQQRACDVTVEIPFGEDGSTECFSAELRIAGSDHDCGLDEGHPVIYVHQDEVDHEPRSDFDQIADDIGV